MGLHCQSGRLSLAKMLLTHPVEVKYSMVSGSPRNLDHAVLLRGLSSLFEICLFGFVLWCFLLLLGFFLPCCGWLLLEFVFSVTGKGAPVAMISQGISREPAVALVWLVILGLV